MPATSDELALYLHLARASERRRRPLVRDKLLVLAGKTAVEMHLGAVAEHCRAKILAHNPGHILRNFSTMAEALADDGFRVFYKRLAQAYPRERAEHMLRSLGIQLAGERHVYADDLEYAAALLGTTIERLNAPGPEAKPSTARSLTGAGQRDRANSGETNGHRNKLPTLPIRQRSTTRRMLWIVVAAVLAVTLSTAAILGWILGGAP
jgi:hypothetical protein